MTENDIRGYGNTIVEAIDRMSNPESERDAEDAARTAVTAGVKLLVGFLIDVHRIAETSDAGRAVIESYRERNALWG